MSTEQIQEIPLGQITAHLGNRRVGGFDQEKLKQLAESIRMVGVQQPAVVRRHPGQADAYQLVAGERRLRASKLAGKDTLPCVVRELDDLQVLRIQTIENLQREDVHPLDEADGYARLIEVAKYDVEKLAAEVGKSASYVYQRLKLRDLVPAARKLLEDGTITAGHAILIARLQPEDQKEAAKECAPDQFGREMSVRELTHWIYQEVYLSLAKAPFKKDDAELVPKAGACTMCPKRTGFQPTLFADVGKDDQCLDRACYHRKLDALVARRAAELESEGVKVVHVHSRASNYYEQEKDKKAVHAYDYVSAKKSEKGAVALLVTTGTDRGQVSYGKPRPKERYTGFQPSPEQKKREEARKAKERETRRQRSSLADQVLEHIEKHFRKTGNLPEDVLRVMALATLQHAYGDQLGWIESALKIEIPPGGRTMDGQNKRRQVVEKAVGALKADEIPIYLARVLILEDATNIWHNSSREDLLKALAEARKIKPAPAPKTAAPKTSPKPAAKKKARRAA